MLPLIYAYLCIPRRFQFLARWFAMLFVVVVLVMVVILFSRILLTMPSQHQHRAPSAHPASANGAAFGATPEFEKRSRRPNESD